MLKTVAGRAVIGTPNEQPPYDGAKPYFLIEDLDNKEFLCTLLNVTWDELPLPKPKKPKQPKKAIKQKQVKTKTDLQKIPGVGKNMEQHLINIGYDCVESLIGQSPEEMYAKNNAFKGYTDDRCVLYCFRCAVYYAETP